MSCRSQGPTETLEMSTMVDPGCDGGLAMQRQLGRRAERHDHSETAAQDDSSPSNRGYKVSAHL